MLHLIHQKFYVTVIRSVEVLRLGLSRPLRGLIALSLAASLVLRGLWAGPWLMNVKGQPVTRAMSF